MTLPTDQLSRWFRNLALMALAAGLLTLAVVSDHAIVRPKLAWGRGLILSGACLLLLSQSLAGQLISRWPAFTGIALIPSAVAGLWYLFGDPTSPPQARDEIVRLAMIPLAAWLTAGVLEGPQSRRLLVGVLAVAGIWVGGLALLERIGGLGGLSFLGIDPTSRSDAGFGNPVFLGAWLVLTTPLLLAEALTESSAWRWPAALAAGLCLPALLATGSAGAWLGFGVAVVIGLVLLIPASRALTTALAGSALGAAALLAMHPHILIRPRTHGLIWRDTLAMCFDRPWGVGPGQFQIEFLPYASKDLLAAHPRASVIINDAHCEALQVLAELGLPGLLALALATWFLFRALGAVLKGPADRAQDVARLVAIVAGIGGGLTQSFVSPDLRFGVSTLLLGTLIGLAASFSDSITLSLPGGRPLRWALSALALTGLWFTGNDTHSRLSITDLLPPGQPLQITDADFVRLSQLREATQAFPNDPKTHYGVAAALAAMNRPGEAADEMAIALQLSPGNPTVIRPLGILQAMAGRFDAAVANLSIILEVAPDDHDVRYLLAFSAFTQGDLRAANIQVEELLKRDPNHARGRLLREWLRQ
ncbi:MAG: tetratricopeptide (TPR) repeat protein [Pseudohongiellaceae bacterium]|jgi:tetratricopeptide (TPR) repeat protein